MKQNLNQQYLFLNTINKKLSNRFLRIYVKRIEGKVDHRVKNMFPAPPKYTNFELYEMLLLYVSIYGIKDDHFKKIFQEEGVKIDKEVVFNEALENLYDEMERLDIKDDVEQS